MSAKPPIILPTAKVAGVVKTPAPGPEENKNIFPQTLSNGTILLDKIGSGQHVISLIKQTDPAQKYAFLVDCKCGVQGRAHLEQDVREYAAYHLKNKGLL